MFLAGHSTHHTELADALAGQDMCTGKGPGAKCRVGIALSLNSAPASPTTSPWDHSSFISNCNIALLIGISPGKLKFKAKSTKLKLVKGNHTILS